MKLQPGILATLFFGLMGVHAANWPAWRGPSGTGITTETHLPTRWSDTENVRWKISLPERGNSTPVVWGGKIFLTQSLEEQGKRSLMCLDRKDGSQLWQAGIDFKKSEPSHRTNPYCSPSPVTDGERVIVWFGSGGLYCYDFAGKEIWRRDLGKQEHEWGHGSSPVIQGNLCYLYFGPGERTFLLAVDKKSGKTVWQQDLPPRQPESRTDGFAGQTNGVIGSWSTPILVKANGREELVLSIPEELRGFDPKNGKELWRCRGLNPLVYTSPIFGDNVVVGMGGFHGTTIAVEAGGSGDVTETHRLWLTTRTKNRLGSGVIHEGHVYILNTPGVGECIDLKTGNVVWEERMRGIGAKTESWSSMVLSGDKIYILNQSGDCIVFKASPIFEILEVNSIGSELTNASLAVSDGELFIRTHQQLWCIAEAKK